jgi:glycosyltransferase involved in cell wall biosynthesis
MRIAIFSDNFHPELSGISDSLITSGKELARRGHVIHFYAPEYSRADYKKINLEKKEVALGDRIAITRFRSFPYPTGTGQGRVVIPTVLRSIQVGRFKPDIIHVHLPFGVGLEGLCAARILGKPLVGTDHTPIAEFARYSPIKADWLGKFLVRYNAWFYNRCHFISSPAQSIFDHMASFSIQKPHRVVPNPIDLETFRPLSDKKFLKKKYGFSKFTVLYAGRLAPEKSIDVFIKAVALLSEKILDINAVIVGKGSAEDDLRRLAEALGVKNRIKFLGFLEKAQTFAEVYNASDVFVIASATETQSLAAMQAMASGIPVIGARAWGLAEYINQDNGILVDPYDEKAFAEKILYLFKHTLARKRLGRGGVKFVQSFSPPTVAKQWEEIYGGVIERYNQKK